MKQTKLVVLLIVLGIFFNLPVFPWERDELPPGFTVAEKGFPVEFDGEPIFYFRINSKAETAEQIAQRLSERLLKLAQDPTFRPQIHHRPGC